MSTLVRSRILTPCQRNVPGYLHLNVRSPMDASSDNSGQPPSIAAASLLHHHTDQIFGSVFS